MISCTHFGPTRERRLKPIAPLQCLRAEPNFIQPTELKKGSLEVLKHTRIFKNEGIQFSSFFLKLCAFYTNIKKQLVRKLDMILLKTVLF